MKEIPLLIRTETTERIPARTFDDLQLTKLFSEGTRKILACPCSATEILRRQEIFRTLTDETCEHLRTILGLLSRLESLENNLMTAGSPTRRIFRQCARLETFLSATDLLLHPMSSGPLFEEIRDFLQTEKQEQEQKRIRAATEEARDLLNRISRLDFGAGFQSAKEIPTESEQIFACAAALGCNILPSREKKLSLGKAEPEYRAVFAETLQSADNLISPFRSKNLQPLIRYSDAIRFFLEIHEFFTEGEKRSIPHCYPMLSDHPEFRAKNLYDPTLLHIETEIVPNDAWFTDEEPFFFLTGANGGGKTTYLRAVGCNLILAAAGCPILGEETKIFPFSTVLTHFPEDETFEKGGRLEKELHRANEILTSEEKAFLLFNEPFSSTDGKRGEEELKKLASELKRMKLSGLCVTHLHGAVPEDFPRLSTVVTEEEGGHRRSYRIRKQEGEKKSYAKDILKKYGLDEASLRERKMQHEDKYFI